jgi:flagellar capping protein FliD
MKHLNNSKNNTIETAATLFTLATILFSGAAFSATIQSAQGYSWRELLDREAPLAASGDNVYITWTANRTTGIDEVFFIRSTDNGETFEDPINLSNDSLYSVVPNIAADGDNVMISWSSINNDTLTDVYLRTSSDGGETFGEVQRLGNETATTTPSTANQTYGEVRQWIPRWEVGPVAVSGSNMYIAWPENMTSSRSSTEIFFMASTDNGETFGERINLSNTPDAASEGPNIAADGDNVYVTFWDSRTGEDRAFFMASTDNGETFGDPIMLNATAPAPATAGNAATTTAEEEGGGAEEEETAPAVDDAEGGG